MLLKAEATSILARALSRWVLNIFKDKNSASFWSKLSQCLTSQWEEWLYPVGIFLFLQPQCLCCACMTSVWLHQVYSTSLSWCRIMWALCPSFLFLRLDKSFSVSLSSHILCFTPLSTVVAPLSGVCHWHFPSTWESKTGFIIPGNLKRVKCSRIILSLTCWLYSCWNSPVSPFTVRVHCWLMVNLFYTRTSGHFSIKQAFCPISSEPILRQRVILTQEGLYILFAAEHNEVSVGIFLHFVEVCMNGNLVPNPPSSPLDSVSPTKLQLVHSIPVSRWMMKILPLTPIGRMIPETQEISGKYNLCFLLSFTCKMVNIKFQSYGGKKQNKPKQTNQNQNKTQKQNKKPNQKTKHQKTLMLTSLCWENL